MLDISPSFKSNRKFRERGELKSSAGEKRRGACNFPKLLPLDSKGCSEKLGGHFSGMCTFGEFIIFYFAPWRFEAKNNQVKIFI